MFGSLARISIAELAPSFSTRLVFLFRKISTFFLISADVYQQKSEPLKKSLAKLQKEQEKTNKDTRSWYEIIETTLMQLSRVTKDFNEGTIADKRRVLSALGSNPI